MPEINRSEYNSNEAIARRVSELTNHIDDAMPLLRYNGAVASTLLDWMMNLWEEFKPVATNGINAKIYDKQIVEIDGLFTKLFNDAYMQEKRASRYGKLCGADAEFLSDVRRLKMALHIIGQRLGFGMNIKHFPDYGKQQL